MKTKRQTKKRKNKKCTKTIKVRRLSYKRKTRQRKTCKRRVYQLGGETHKDLSPRYNIYDPPHQPVVFPQKFTKPVRVKGTIPDKQIEADKIKRIIGEKHNDKMQKLCPATSPAHKNCGKWRTKTHKQEYNTNNTFKEMKTYFQGKAQAEHLP